MSSLEKGGNEGPVEKKGRLAPSSREETERKDTNRLFVGKSKHTQSRLPAERDGTFSRVASLGSPKSRDIEKKESDKGKNRAIIKGCCSQD